MKMERNGSPLEKTPVSGDENMSKDAYMLVYKRSEAEPPAPRQPPLRLQEGIEADNVAFNEHMAEHDKKKAELGEIYDHIREVKLDVCRCLDGVSGEPDGPEGRLCGGLIWPQDDLLVPRDALQHWIRGVDLAAEWDVSSIICEHDQVDPNKTGNVRLISRAAWEKLHELGNLPELDVCAVCVAEGFASRLKAIDHENQCELFRSLRDEDEGAAPKYAVPAKWLEAWLASEGNMTTGPTEPEYTLSCNHGRPSGAFLRRTPVTQSGLAVLRSIFGHFEAHEMEAPACETCAEEAESEKAARDQWKAERKEDLRLLSQQVNQTAVLKEDVYMLPVGYVEEWGKFNKGQRRDRPKLGIDLCPHGKLDFDPKMERRDYITSEGWERLCEL